MAASSASNPLGAPIPPTWKEDINNESSLAFIKWEALQTYAARVKRQRTNSEDHTTCYLSLQYSKGGLHVVRQLYFGDGTSWVARLQMERPTKDSRQRLVNEIHTIQVLRERSMVPIPDIITYEDRADNAVGVLFMIFEFIPADIAMDKFQGRLPTHLKKTYYDEMAAIQVEMSSVRFPKIGSIIKLDDETYSVGAIPGIGGPFDTAADFFQHWAKWAKFGSNDAAVEERTPPERLDAVRQSIKEFPSQLSGFAQRHFFHTGPFPVFHTDLHRSNVLIDSEHRVLNLIDWENAIVGPWEMVEFIKNLTVVPMEMEGPSYCEGDYNWKLSAERTAYLEVIKKIKGDKQLDNKLSTVLGDQRSQNLAQACWLYLEGRIGYYTSIFPSSVQEDIG